MRSAGARTIISIVAISGPRIAQGPALYRGAHDSTAIVIMLGDGSFSSLLNINIAGNPSHVALGDFDNDGRADVATANQNANNLAVLLNVNILAGVFGGPAYYAAGSKPVHAMNYDLDADGRRDLVAANENSDNI